MSISESPRPTNPDKTGLSRTLDTLEYPAFDSFRSSEYYDGVSSLFIDTYNAPPWNEVWSKELVEQYLRMLMQFPTAITMVGHNSELDGFFIGAEGDLGAVVPQSVRAYFGDARLDFQEDMARKISEQAQALGFDGNVFWGCDYAVRPEKRGATAGRLLREAVRGPVERGITTMYGMTMEGSPFHEITERRGAQMLLRVSDMIPGDPRVFKAMDMTVMIGGKRD